MAPNRIETLREALLKDVTLVNGKKKLSCAKAFNLGREFNASLKEIADICTAEGIKISDCQLGCF